MTTATLWLIIKAVAVAIPLIIAYVQEGRIKTATAKEIEDAFTKASEDRVKRAINARDGPDDGMPDGFDRD